MRRTKTKNLIFAFSVFISFFTTAFGQDIHLSHIHASPTILNPAMTGLFEGQARVIANTRSQWNSVTKGYKTVVGSADMKLAMVNKQDFISIGFQSYADRAGDLNFTTSSAGIALAYLKSFDKRGRNWLSFGIQNSFVGNRVDYSRMVAFDHIPAFTQGTVNRINYWDVSAGLGWFFKPDRYNSIYLGVSAFHLNNPQVSFNSNEYSGEANYLFRRINIHGGANIRVSNELRVKPSFLFMDQGPHQEINFGSFIQYKTYRRGLHKRPLYFIYLGAWLRSYIDSGAQGVDAMITSLRLDYRKMFITLSYDINISSYRLASGGRGGLEFSIIRIFDWERPERKGSKVKCPVM